MLVIDGSCGEGGGAVLRNSLSLSTVLGQETRIENIRAGRPNPGLQAQHLTAVLALARICRAELEGAEFTSQTLTFRPQSPPQSGDYSWDVAAARKGGSAGATTLILQALLPPLLLAERTSRVMLEGGTHVAWSPPFHYVQYVYLPALGRVGVRARAQIERWGWYPQGKGLMTAEIEGAGTDLSARDGLQAEERGTLKRVWGISAISGLPEHIAQRQKTQAEKVLRAEGLEPEIETIYAPALGQGTAVFLVAEFEKAEAGFTSLGRKGRPAERVADEACEQFLRYYRSEAALDQHLADQLIIPLSLVRGRSEFTTCRITQHLLTNAWIAQQFLDREVIIEGVEGKPGRVIITGRSDV
jgi:RNA 3'-terminal phosphate cyclase (ATP)